MEALRGPRESLLRAAPASALTSEHVSAAAARGDVLAAEIWDEACEALAIAIVNLQHLINPQVVLLGGGMSNAGAPLLQSVRYHFQRRTWRLAPDHPHVDLAILGEYAGAIGAAALAKRLIAGSASEPLK
jgi:glucokinase